MAGTRTLYLIRHGAAGADGELTPAGRRQAELTGQRLAEVPFAAVHHGPLPRATQTARLVAAHLAGVPVHADELADDYVPYVPPGPLSGRWQDLFGDCAPAELADGARRAAAAVDRFATVAEQDTHELVVTHGFLTAWLVRHVLDAPAPRRLGINQANCAITVLRFAPERPPGLVVFNETGHLPPDLRWTGFPAALRP